MPVGGFDDVRGHLLFFGFPFLRADLGHLDAHVAESNRQLGCVVRQCSKGGLCNTTLVPGVLCSTALIRSVLCSTADVATSADGHGLRRRNKDWEQSRRELKQNVYGTVRASMSAYAYVFTMDGACFACFACFA